MNKERFAEAISMVDDKYYEEAANYQRKKKTPVWVRWGAMAACLLIALSIGAVAVAAAMGYDLVGWILAARAQKNDSPNPAMIQEQIGKGQWVYLNDDNLAVILPESPAKILLSSDGGETWRELTVRLPEKYANGDQIIYVFTPGSPTFNGSDGVYPIEVLDQSDGAAETIHLYSGDYGMTWRFR